MPSNRGSSNVVLNGNKLVDRPSQVSIYASVSPKLSHSRQSQDYSQSVIDQISGFTSINGGVFDPKSKNLKDGEARSPHHGKKPVTVKTSSFHSFTDNYQTQAHVATLKNQLNQLTVSLANKFLEEEFLTQQLNYLISSRAQTSSSTNDTHGAALNRLRQKTDMAETAIERLNLQITEFRKKTDARKIRRRYLLAKKIESQGCTTKTDQLKSEIDELKRKIKDCTNDRETAKYLIISELEKSMRSKAEMEAMKAASKSKLINDDPELKSLVQQIGLLEQRA
jgi:hypothetical protein